MNKRKPWVISLMLVFAMLFSTVGTAAATELAELPDQPATAADIDCPTQEEAYQRMIALKATYPEGLTWTNYKPYGNQGDKGAFYRWKGGKLQPGNINGGVGCAAFAMILSDAAFGSNLKGRIVGQGNFSYDDIKVGDILRVNGNSHFVIVLQKGEGGVIVAEGNYNKSVHWGRAISRAEVESAAFIVTRYPEGYDPDGGVANNAVVKRGTEGGLSWTLTQGKTLTISGNTTMPDFTESSQPSWMAESFYTIVIEDGVKGIGDYAFYQSDALSVSIAGSVKDIGEYAFSECGNLTSVTLSEGIEAIGRYAFKSCAVLEYVDFPSSIKSVGAGAFMDCTDNLRQVRFMPNSNNIELGGGIFTMCWHLNLVSLPEGITELPPDAFSSCKTIFYLYIPSTVTTLGQTGVNSPFISSYVGTIYFGGTQEQWEAMMTALESTPSLKFTTYAVLSAAHVEFEQDDPFAPETPTNDMIADSSIDPDTHEQKDCPNKAALKVDQTCTVCQAQGEVKYAAVDCPDKSSHGDIAEGKTCPKCDYVGEPVIKVCEHTHTTATPLTGDDTGYHKIVCNDCGKTVEEKEQCDARDGGACSECGYAKHVHTWSTGDKPEDWGHDDNQHWRVCTDYNCPDAGAAKNAVAMHDFVDDENDPENVTSVCSVCGMAKPVGYEPPEHSWAEDWSKDETHHWHACTDAECEVRNDYFEHDYTSGNEADTCACGTEKPHEHSWAENWSSDATHHWHVCAAEDGGQNNYAEHSFGEWAIDTPATTAEVGARHRVCAICQYEQTETIPIIPDTPAPSEHEHTWAGALQYDVTGHWYACTGSDCSEKKGFAAHSYDDWVIDVLATATTSGSRHRACTACGYSQTETIPATGGGYIPSNPGSNGGGNNTPTKPAVNTVTNPDGSTTTTTTDQKTGAVTETIKKTDGTTIVMTTQKDGSSVSVTTQKNGTIATVSTGATGTVTANVQLSAAVINAAGGKPVVLPINDVRVTDSLVTAEAITVSTGGAGAAKVTIPATNTTPGTVAVIVHPNGLTEIVKTSVATKDGVITSVPDGATVKVIDNSKNFADVSGGNWYNNAVDFVSARGLFAGTSASSFSPSASMNRAMMVTVLARLDGADLTGGATWYEKSMQWAKANGVSDGSNMNGNISREQLVTMIWRYMGSPTASSGLSGYADAGQVSGYANNAMAWAIENGIVSGYGNGRLGPQNQATRAEVAQILQNLITNLDLPQ